jgi:peptide/nickel transport system permease protein
MTLFIIRRLISGFLVILGIVLIVFFLFMVLPGDPARLTLGQRSDVSTLQAIHKEFGFDKPKTVQLLDYLNDLSPVSYNELTKEQLSKYHYALLIHFSGDHGLVVKWPWLRRSYQNQQKVSEILLEALPNTIVLALSAFIIAALFGILFGTLAAVYRGTVFESIIMVVANAGISIPSFFAAIIIAWVFGFVLNRYTGLNMFGSLYDIDPVKGRYIDLKNLILPAIALGVRPLAIIAQLTRSSMLDVLHFDFMRTAKAKGLSNTAIVIRHGLRNALNPVLTAVSGWLASLMAGAFFIEYIFGWRGLGKITVDALLSADLPVVMGSVLFIGIIFVLINILVDILYGVLDPRVRIG